MRDARRWPPWKRVRTSDQSGSRDSNSTTKRDRQNRRRLRPIDQGRLDRRARSVPGEPGDGDRAEGVEWDRPAIIELGTFDLVDHRRRPGGNSRLSFHPTRDGGRSTRPGGLDLDRGFHRQAPTTVIVPDGRAEGTDRGQGEDRDPDQFHEDQTARAGETGRRCVRIPLI